MPQSMTQSPAWVVGIQTAAKVETRSQPWKAVVQAVPEAQENRDLYNVEREPTGTDGAVQ